MHFSSRHLRLPCSGWCPEEKLEMVSGMNSFSMNLVTIASPVLAAFCYGVFGMGSVLLIDIVSFMAAFPCIAVFDKD